MSMCKNLFSKGKVYDPQDRFASTTMPPKAKYDSATRGRKKKVRKIGMKASRKRTFVRLDAFTRGMIWGMHVAG